MAAAAHHRDLFLQVPVAAGHGIRLVRLVKQVVDVIAFHAGDPAKSVERYSINSPGARYGGDLEAMAAYAGTSVDDITELASVEEIFARIRAEYREASRTSDPASARGSAHRGEA